MNNNYSEKKGCLISMALSGEFDVITHGCNCFCTMGAGIAPKMAKEFECNNFEMELYGKGDINKLGQIDFNTYYKRPDGTLFVDYDNYVDLHDGEEPYLIVVNSYTQYKYGSNHIDGVKKPIDYEALTLCMRKINHIFAGKHIGLPGLIGCGLAGGKEEIVKEIIKKELKDCDVTIVYLNKWPKDVKFVII